MHVLDLIEYLLVQFKVLSPRQKSDGSVVLFNIGNGRVIYFFALLVVVAVIPAFVAASRPTSAAAATIGEGQPEIGQLSRACTGHDINARVEACSELINWGREAVSQVAHRYNSRGVGHLALGQYDKAERDFLDAIARHAGIVAAYTNLGILHFRLSQYRQAIDWFRKAAERKPTSCRAANGIAEAQEKLGEDATQSHQRVVELGASIDAKCVELARSSSQWLAEHSNGCSGCTPPSRGRRSDWQIVVFLIFGIAVLFAPLVGDLPPVITRQILRGIWHGIGSKIGELIVQAVRLVLF